MAAHSDSKDAYVPLGENAEVRCCSRFLMNGNNATSLKQIYTTPLSWSVYYTCINESLFLAKRTFCSRYDRTSVTPGMEQMNTVASSSIHVNFVNWHMHNKRRDKR